MKQLMKAGVLAVLAVGLIACSEPAPEAAPEAAQEQQVPEAGQPPAGEAGAEGEDALASEFSSAPWDRARERGATFRAVGNEPGWNLDVHADEQLVLVMAYGERTLTTDDPGAEVSRLGDVEVSSRELEVDGETLHVEIRKAPCQDTMSGQRFTHQVTVQLDDTRLEGCGRSLVEAD